MYLTAVFAREKFLLDNKKMTMYNTLCRTLIGISDLMT